MNRISSPLGDHSIDARNRSPSGQLPDRPGCDVCREDVQSAIVVRARAAFRRRGLVQIARDHHRIAVRIGFRAWYRRHEREAGAVRRPCQTITRRRQRMVGALDGSDHPRRRAVRIRDDEAGPVGEFTDVGESSSIRGEAWFSSPVRCLPQHASRLPGRHRQLPDLRIRAIRPVVVYDGIDNRLPVRRNLHIADGAQLVNVRSRNPGWRAGCATARGALAAIAASMKASTGTDIWFIAASSYQTSRTANSACRPGRAVRMRPNESESALVTRPPPYCA